ncbi:MAG: beta family protein [Actinomycetota bacterium]|nr:beta family protein [Actinomycetota bacterium]
MTSPALNAMLPAGFDHGHYVPIILTRQGERLALRTLDGAIKAQCTPLFVLHPVPRDLGTGGPQYSVDEHVRKVPSQLVRDWGTRAAFIDLRHIDPEARMSDGSHPVEWLVSASADAGLTLAPAVSAGRDDAYREAAFDVAQQVGTSVCFRLPPSEWSDLGTTTGAGRLLALLHESGLPPDVIHVILDMEGDVSATAGVSAAALRDALTNLPLAAQWPSVMVAGTSMPAVTSEVGADNAVELARVEWRVWRLLVDEGDLHRLPAFGDYCVQHPDPMSDFDPRYMQSAAQLRYTIPQSWYVARGRGVRDYGHEQVRDLANQILDHPQYAGRDFSWGDTWLAECADGSCSAGNQMVWRKVTTNHHITFLVRQISTLVGA